MNRRMGPAPIRERIRGPVTKPSVILSTEEGDETVWTDEKALLFRLKARRAPDGTYHPTNSKTRKAFLWGAKQLGCLAVVVDDHSDGAHVNDEYIVLGNEENLWALRTWQCENIVCVEQFIGVRIPVIASGAADASATVREAYKDVIREMRMGRTAKLLAKDNRHTDDEGTGAYAAPDAVRVPLGVPYARPDAVAQVIDNKDVVLDDVGNGIVRKRDSQAVRSKRMKDTRAAVNSRREFKNGKLVPIEKQAKALEDFQLDDAAVIYCGNCARPKSLCKCGCEDDGLTSKQIQGK